MRSSLQDASLYYRASLDLKRRIKRSLQQEVEADLLPQRGQGAKNPLKTR